MMEKTGCSGVMIARAVRGNPWIFAELVHGKDAREARPTVDEKAATVLQHYEWTKAMMGEYRAVVEMRKHLSWYSKGLPRAVELRRTLQRLDDPEELPRLVEEYFVDPEEP